MPGLVNGGSLQQLSGRAAANTEPDQTNLSWLKSCPFGPGVTRRFGENSNRYFRCTRAQWKCSTVDGFSVIAARRSRVGFIQSEQNPAISRSKTRRLGARRRERTRARHGPLSRRAKRL